MRRFPVDKGRSARRFKKHGQRTRAANMISPMRGGWRL